MARFNLAVLFLLPVTAGMAATSTTISFVTSANPVVLGHPLTLTASVSPAGVNGSVTFYDGQNILGVEPLVGGQATLTTSLLPSGNRSLKALYPGNADFLSSTSSLIPQTVVTVPGSGFQAPVGYSAGGTAVHVAAGDFNGDGKTDFAVANADTGNISILLGNGDGTFQAATNFPTPSSARFVAVADFNGDGKPDLAIADFQHVSILMGNGDGTFRPAVNLALTGALISVAVGDFNGDGRADIAVANEQFKNVNILLGNGDGTFQAPVNYPTGLLTYSVLVADFNGDGKPDIAAFDLDLKNVVILYGNGDGTFQASSTFLVPSSFLSVAVADFNGDGKADMAVSGGSGVSILLGNGDGTFQSQNLQTGVSGSMALGDFNGDGKIDLVSSSFGAFNVLLGNGDGTFQAPTRYSFPPGASSNFGAYVDVPSLLVGNFNGDGRDDLAVAAGQLYILMAVPPSSIALSSSSSSATYGQSVTLMATVSLSSNSRPASGTVSFYDGNHLLGTVPLGNDQATLTVNLLAAGTHAITAVYSGDGADAPSTSAVLTETVTGASPVTLTSSPNPSVFGQNITLTASVSPSAATGTVRFYDGATLLGNRPLGDGHATLSTSLLASGSHALTAYYSGDSNNPLSVSPVVTQQVTTPAESGFSTSVNYAVGSLPSAIVETDLNGDGIGDLAVANFGSSNISVLLGNGDGTFKSPVNYVGGGNPLSLAAGDFNGDGKMDLAVANFGNNNVSVLLGNGDGTFQAAANYPAGAAPGSVAAGDFNGDGKLDLAVADRGSASVSVLLGNGDGTFSQPVPYPTYGGSQPAVAVGDFNNDGKQDLVVAGFCPGLPYLNVLMGNGDGTFQPAISHSQVQSPCAASASGTPDSVIVSDFNGDGNADVAFGTFVYAGNGQGALSPLPGAGNAFSFPAGTAAGDFNGDGKMDLAAVFPSPASVSLYLNTGNNFPGSATYHLGAIPSAVIVGDFNGDGLPDLAIANGAANTVTIQLGTFTSVPPTVAIDSPAPGAVVSGIVPVTGWAMDNISAIGTAIGDVLVSVDGTVVGNAAYGTVRIDACAAYPGRAGCPNVGYSYSLNTATLTPGPHTLTVTATDSDLTPDTGSRSLNFTVANPQPLVAIDSPAPGSNLTGTFTVSGWALDSGASPWLPIVLVFVRVDGTAVGVAAYGSVRGDACAAYPGRPNCPNVGYTFTLNAATLSPGRHVLQVVAQDAVSNTGSNSITINTSGPIPPSVYIDSLPQNSTISGAVGVAGWAIDNTTSVGTAINKVQVEVDGVVVGNAYYGVFRPDVCAVYPGRPGCPNVGFSYVLDPATLRAGNHTITVIATDSDGIPDSGSYTLNITVASPQ